MKPKQDPRPIDDRSRDAFRVSKSRDHLSLSPSNSLPPSSSSFQQTSLFYKFTLRTTALLFLIHRLHVEDTLSTPHQENREYPVCTPWPRLAALPEHRVRDTERSFHSVEKTDPPNQQQNNNDEAFKP